MTAVRRENPWVEMGLVNVWFDYVSGQNPGAWRGGSELIHTAEGEFAESINQALGLGQCRVEVPDLLRGPLWAERKPDEFLTIHSKKPRNSLSQSLLSVACQWMDSPGIGSRRTSSRTEFP